MKGQFTQKTVHAVRVLMIGLALLTCAGETFAQRRGGGNRRVAPQAHTWYVNANGSDLTITLTETNNEYSGTLTPENGAPETLDNIAWDQAGGALEFRRNSNDGAAPLSHPMYQPIYQWFRVDTRDGLLTGRFTQQARPEHPQSAYEYKWHVTGWNAELGASLTPRVYDINANGYLGRLRIDRTEAPGVFQGRLKFYARQNTRNDMENYFEYLEEDVTINQWDGLTLQFQRGVQTYNGQISGRHVSGTFTYAGGLYGWAGKQAEVLGHGLASRTAGDAAEWRRNTRRRLERLIMAGNPAPLSVTMTGRQTGIRPVAMSGARNDRDDNWQAWSQDYTITQYELRMLLANPFGGAPIRRNVRARLAIPNTAQFAGGKLPLVIALNGHGGNAEEMFNPENPFFWFGDGYARRGYAVLSVDITHRAIEDRVYFRRTAALGDDLGYPGDNGEVNDTAPWHTAHSHRPTRAELAEAAVAEGDDRFYTDWEEDGERAWAVMRTLDWLLANAEAPIDANRMMITGLSMGGELSTYVAALDTRIAMAVPSGFSPDLSVLKYRESHGCWNWSFADIREYIDAADLFALIAPRPLIIQSGKMDDVYSGYTMLPGSEAARLWREATPESLKTYAMNLRVFAADKEVARRVRAAYGAAAGNFTHNLHYDWHYYHFGDLNPNRGYDGLGGFWVPRAGILEAIVRPQQKGLTTPALTGPEGGRDWQTDERLITDGRTLPEYIEGYLGLQRVR
ncbi:MAG: alpha/beta hydrolase family protein [Blastocatellia bacterium]